MFIGHKLKIIYSRLLYSLNSMLSLIFVNNFISSLPKINFDVVTLGILLNVIIIFVSGFFVTVYRQEREPQGAA